MEITVGLLPQNSQYRFFAHDIIELDLLLAGQRDVYFKGRRDPFFGHEVHDCRLRFGAGDLE